MYKISLFKAVSGILVHLQGGKKKLRKQLNDTRADLVANSQVTHQFGGSIQRKSNRGSRYLGTSKQFSNRILGRASHTSSMRSSVTPISLKEEEKASLDSIGGTSKTGSSYDGMQFTKNIYTLFHLPTNLYPYYQKIPNLFLADYKPSDEHTLLFEWSTISKGWQDGIVAFAKSRALTVCPYAGRELELLDDVLMLPENAVIDIDLIEMDGIGHMTMLQEEERFFKIGKDCVDKLSMEFDERK